MASSIKVDEFENIDHGNMPPELYAVSLFCTMSVERYEWLQENAHHKWKIETVRNVNDYNYWVYIVFHDDVDAVHYRMRWT